MEEVEVRLREMQEELSNYKSLVDSVGWKNLMVVAEDQNKLRMPSILSKVPNLLEITEKEFEKGEVSGITLFMQLPGIVIEGITAKIDQLEEELGYDDAERTTDADGSGRELFEPATP